MFPLNKLQRSQTGQVQDVERCARCRALFKIRNMATECLPGRVANDKIGASLGESSQRVPPTASERGVHVFFAGPRQVMAKSITKDIVQCLPNNSKLTCRFVLYLLLPGSLRLLRSTSLLPGALVLGIISVLRPKLCSTSDIVNTGCRCIRSHYAETCCV